MYNIRSLHERNPLRAAGGNEYGEATSEKLARSLILFFFSSARADITLLDGEDASDFCPVRDVIESTISRHPAPYSVGYACYDGSR